MNDLISAVSERKTDFFEHLTLAHSLEQKLLEGESTTIGDTTLSVNHLRAIKSSLIIHLYNIVEAVMTQTIRTVGDEVLLTQPKNWSEDTIKEWLRAYALFDINGSEETRLDTIHGAALKLLGKETIEQLFFKKPSGSWSDTVIHTFAKRLKVNFPLNEEIGRMIAKSPKYGDKSPMVFLADRRNAIAHGRRSFSDGANDMSIPDIEKLAESTIAYLESAVYAFQRYLDQKIYLDLTP